MTRIHRASRQRPQKLPADVEAVATPTTVARPKPKPKLEQQKVQLTSLDAPAMPGTASKGRAVTTMAEELVKASGFQGTAAQLLRREPGLAATLREFSVAFESAPAAQRGGVLQRALRHHLVHSGAQVDDVFLKALGTRNAHELATAYARDLGYQGVSFDGKDWHVVGGPQPTKLDAPDGTLVSLGTALNTYRFNTAAVVPPQAVPDVGSDAFHVGNAHLAVHLATLAYQPPDVIEAQLEQWGFDVSTFRWVEDQTTDTQGFVVADRAGNVFPTFRGSESGQDWKTNAQTLLSKPGWQPAPGFETHGGFTKALDSVWPQVRDAIAQATEAAGPNAKVMFAGHSLGGALTQLAAVRAAREGLVDGARAAIYTLGSPRVGDDAFKHELERHFPRAFRMVNYEDRFLDRQDLVTQIPPKAMGFRHAGSVARLGPDVMRLIGAHDRDNASLRGALESLQMDGTPRQDPRDPENAEIERMSQAELEAFMMQLAAEQTATRPAGRASVSGDAGPGLESTRAMQDFAVPSVSAHSTGVYLDRITVQTRAEPDVFR